MNKFKQAWNFLSGKKTIIGAVICFAVYVVKGLDQFFGLNFVDAGVLSQVNEAGMALLGVGLAHKAIKQM